MEGIFFVINMSGLVSVSKKSVGYTCICCSSILNLVQKFFKPVQKILQFNYNI